MNTHGMVITPHPKASDVGRAVIDSGGDAISAAIAINAVLAVVCPHFCGLGGDAVWMVSDGRGQEACLMGIGQGISAPAQQKTTIPKRGPGSILTTAGAVDSWAVAQSYAESAWNCSRSISELLAPAISVAEAGHTVSKSMANWLDFRGEETQHWPGFSAIFERGGVRLSSGDNFKQPKLAKSLRYISRDGPRSFYDGVLAEQILQGLEDVGSSITVDDLIATKTKIVSPISQCYRGVNLLSPPPPTQGITTLQIMGILEHFNFSEVAEDSVKHFHLVVEAVKQAFLEREKVADPNFTQDSLDWMLNKNRLAHKAASISETALSWNEPLQKADTVYFGVVDKEGRCASVLQSTYYDWGSGVAVGDTGILWNNRGAAFNADQYHPNSFGTGKLPFFTLNPGIALKDGKPFLLYGTQGADGQPQTLALLLTRLIDYGRSPFEALNACRFLLGRTFSDNNDTLKIEDGLPKSLFEGLTSRGHEVAHLAELSPLAGQAGVIKLNAVGDLEGAHDPRGEGTALLC